MNEYFNIKTNKWVKEYYFYYGDLSKTLLKNDWRFKEIKGKRKQLIFLGLVKTDFPVKYPLKTLCGKTINKLL